jgi:hypothetical protein
MVGKGVMISEDGEKYVGNFINNTAHGFGKIDYPDGDKSIGFFVSHQLYTGKIISKDGTITYYHKQKEVDEKIVEAKMHYQPKIGVELT